MAKKEEGTLALMSQIDTKELGANILEAAQEKMKSDLQRIVVEGVQNILRDVENQRSHIQKAEDRIKLQNRRVEALRKGEFKIKMNGDIGGPMVQFDDVDLNQGGL